jgi:two-component sensor histidine kinase
LHDHYTDRLCLIEALAQAARERADFNVVVREIHHRTKNNFQIITGFITQRFRDVSPEIRERLNAVLSRIQALALAHDVLSVGDKPSSLQMNEYLHSICVNLRALRPDVSIEVISEPITIPIDRAVPAGLVVNELATNSLKYAFGNSGGQVTVHFTLVANSSEACLSVEDDGKGMDLPPKRGLGLNLVETFAQQLQGRVDFHKLETGLRTTLCFPVAA